MRYLSWMVLLVCVLAAPADIPRVNTVYHYANYFELNHRYDNNGKLMFDQLIIWEWVDYQYQDEDGRTKSRREKKVVDWYMTKYRKKLTPEEQKKKNRELAQEWVKKFGKGADLNAPPYTPPFQGGILVPRLDQKRQYWKVLIHKKTVIHVMYCTSFVETWTQFDPEVDNQKLFSTDTRRYPLRKTYARPKQH